MLVLSRQRDESIIIGDNIVITIVDIRGDKVRLGIDAPKEVPVHRQEVYDAIQRERSQADSGQIVSGESAGEYHGQYRLENSMSHPDYGDGMLNYTSMGESVNINAKRGSLMGRVFG
jgi:carbon storage regulator